MGLLDKLMKSSTKIENGVLLKAGTKDLQGEKVYYVPESVLEISNNAFKNKKGEWEEIEGVIFNNGTVNIPSFSGNNYLKWPVLTNACKIKKIPAKTFKNCKSLTRVTMPYSGMTEIGESAFEGCEKLSFIENGRDTNIELPYDLEKIGNNAFKGCNLFASVTIPHSVTFVGDGAFDCENLKTVKFEGLMPNYANNPFGKSVERVIYRDHEIRLPLNRFPACPETPKLRAGQVMQVAPFVDYAIQNNKKLPKQMTIIRDTKPTEIKDFYDHADDFINLTKDYLTAWDDVLEISRASDDDIISAYHKACIATGVFSPNDDDRSRAQKFMRESIVKMSPEALVKEFTYFNTFYKGYDKEFADYYISGFEETIDRKGNKNYGVAGNKNASWTEYMRSNGTDRILEGVHQL